MKQIKKEHNRNKHRSGWKNNKQEKKKKKKEKNSLPTKDSWSSNDLHIYKRYVKPFLKNIITIKNKTIWSNVCKQYHSLKRKPRKIKLLQLYERFQLQCEQESG